MCTNKNIPIDVEEPVVIEGWVGKAKGSFQVLNERGWVDPNRIHLYTGEGKQRKDELSLQEGNNDEYKIAEEFSINKLMTLQRDFLDEVTLLKYYAQQMGVCVDFTPKCHPEVAGEGIEYDLGYIKAQLLPSTNQ